MACVHRQTGAGSSQRQASSTVRSERQSSADGARADSGKKRVAAVVCQVEIEQPSTKFSRSSDGDTSHGAYRGNVTEPRQTSEGNSDFEASNRCSDGLRFIWTYLENGHIGHAYQALLQAKMSASFEVSLDTYVRLLSGISPRAEPDFSRTLRECLGSIFSVWGDTLMMPKAFK